MNEEIKRDDAGEVSFMYVKRTRIFYSSIVVVTIIFLGVAYLIMPVILGDKEGSPHLRQMRKLMAKIGELEAGAQAKRKELLHLVEGYCQKIVEKRPLLSALGLSEEGRKIVTGSIISEEDAEKKSRLQAILDKDDEIKTIKGEISRHEALLPTPYIVKTDEETHYEIAMDFLVNIKKIEKERALALLKRVALFEPLKTGFRVWNFFSGDSFVTFVTQGSADISPNEYRQTRLQSLIEDRDKAREELKLYGIPRTEIISEVMQLREEKKELKKQVDDLSKENKEIVRIINSLFYILDLEDNLMDRDILKRGGFLGLGSLELKEIPWDYFDQSIDLREKTTIVISAKQLKLKEIDGITLYPKFYEEGDDYKVKIEEGGKKAVVKILNREKFKKERVIISVE
jgi:hypothetical protein